MEFIIGEGWQAALTRLAYRGTIGLFYNSTFGGIIAYLIFGLFCLFAIIGLVSTVKVIFVGFKPRKKKQQ